MLDEQLQAWFGEATQAHQVPGASLAVLVGSAVYCAVAGVRSVGTLEAVTPETLFQLGSATKPWTAAALMRLVDAEKLDLNAPVAGLLGDPEVASAPALMGVNLRHLLSHTSGLPGDYLLDLGEDDGVLARYASRCGALWPQHAPGETMSYCNTGYILAGRLLEVLTGKVWDEAMRDLLFSPLRLRRTVTSAHDALRLGVARGHTLREVPPSDGPGPERKAAMAWQEVPRWEVPRTLGPAGAICTTATELLAFARLHLEHGVTADGTRLLSKHTIDTLDSAHVAVPEPWSVGSHWGLGMALATWCGRRVLAHPGSGAGQFAFLHIVPDRGLAIALLTNGGHAGLLHREVLRVLLAELADLEVPAPLAPAARSAGDVRGALGEKSWASLVGVYERLGLRLEVEAKDDTEGVLRVITTGPVASLAPQPVHALPLRPVAPRQGVFATQLPHEDGWKAVVFYQLDDGRQYVHTGLRATPRVH
ncbi:serine hydrolase domain-containing protein [Chondromyces crocatus]|uniref:Penicillin-binding protein n=1 Tax=Chondromyces crocatus TaxID=52 RepID=A0A0K1EK12_CHOCO|nr:serine hydrolase domain-containing protein [Chondromyces crocatus]AKT41017.1 penicillin-binding protein [Chondromyces crocatus]